jgi:hypothetical protein
MRTLENGTHPVRFAPTAGERWSRKSRDRWSLGVILILGAVTACSGNRNLPRYEQTVDGMTIDLGAMPAELVRGHTMNPEGPNAHGGTQAYQGSHHIVVALFDARTGTRIANARVRAGVGDQSYNHEPDTWLEPMEVAGKMTYGNFFPMPGPGLWRIHLEIHRPGTAKATEADFAYEHPAGS